MSPCRAILPAHTEESGGTMLMEKTGHNSDCLVKFMHSDSQSSSFHWRQKDDICLIEIESFPEVIQPTLTGT
jgi:hypothetical protein